MRAHVLRHSVLSGSLRPPGLWPARLLCPWDSPGKGAGVGCHALLQGAFLTRDGPASLAPPALAGSSLPVPPAKPNSAAGDVPGAGEKAATKNCAN